MAVNDQFAKRLRQALKEAGVQRSATVVATQFNLRYWGDGISSHAARNWLMGVSIPKQDKLFILCNWLKISPEGLLFGTPPPKVGLFADQEESLSLVDRQLMVNYLSMSTDHRRIVREIVDAFLALSKLPTQAN
jgi:transcriptional regulator with XRE-family HTH domain